MFQIILKNILKNLQISKTKIARYVKTHPEELLPEYEVSLWMDANIIISSNVVYECFVKHYDYGTLVATMKHTKWNCVYDEMFSVLCSHSF